MARNRRRSAESNESWKNVFGLLLATIGILTIGVGGYFYIGGTGMKLDDNGCPLNAVDSPEHIVILVDLTTPFDDSQMINLEGFKEKVFSEIKQYSRFVLYTLSSGSISKSDKVIEVCSPGNPKNVNQWTQTQKRVQLRWRDQFDARIVEELRKLQNAKGGSTSEILASIKTVTQLEFVAPKAQKTKLIVISDFIENSPGLISMYSETIPSFSGLRRQHGDKYLVSRLEGVETTFLIVDNEPKIQVQDSFKRFWAEYASRNGSLDSSGGRGLDFRDFTRY